MSEIKGETTYRSSPALAAAISATLGVAGMAEAQTSGGLETIIVTATRVEQVTVRYPNGKTARLRNVAVDRVVEVATPRSRAAGLSGPSAPATGGRWCRA